MPGLFLLFLQCHILPESVNFQLTLQIRIFIAAIISVFFGYANFVLTGYFKDIEADKPTAYNTLPVVFGRKISSIVSDVFGFIVSTSVFALVILLSLLIHSLSNHLIKALIFIYTGIGVSIFTQMNLHSVKSDTEAYKAISPCVHSYILVLAGLSVLNKPDWFAGTYCYSIFLSAITLKLRPARNQI
jgi:4-hydroxybenzoate polyprenyltransferase